MVVCGRLTWPISFGEPRLSVADGHILTYAAHRRILAAGALNRWISATA